MSVERAMTDLALRFGAPPRPVSLQLDEVLRPAFPDWLTPEDPLYTTYSDRASDLADARVVIGRLAVANGALFEPDSPAYPGEFVFSWDRWYLRRPSRLTTLADVLAGNYQAEFAPRSPSGRLFAERLTTGLNRTMGRQVPPLMTQGRLVYHATVMIYPEFIPGGRLRKGALVALYANVAPGVRQTYLIPHTYWPASLRATWPE